MASLTLQPGEADPRRIADVVRQLVEGRSNAVGTVTLAANAATTTVAAPTCGPASLPFLFPTTAHASAEWAAGGLYILQSNVTKAQFVITHANNAQADRTFAWVVLG